MCEWLRRHADSSAGFGSQRPAGRVNLPSARFICAVSMQRVSRGFHAVTKAPVRPAYLPCSKTREGVYPCCKKKKSKTGLSGVRFRATSGSLFSVCHQGKLTLPPPRSVVQLWVMSEWRASGARKQHARSFQNGFLIKGTGITLLCYRLYSNLLSRFFPLLYSDKILTLHFFFL